MVFVPTGSVIASALDKTMRLHPSRNGAPGKNGRLESERVNAVKIGENRSGPSPAAKALAPVCVKT